MDSINNIVVSVIVPSYNRMDIVSQTIDSILSQKCNFRYEIIIGDDCSTDGVRDILIAYKEKYPEIIQLLFHEKNIGLAANWATCLKSCKGKYIANCDNDDYWHNPEKLKLQVDFLELNSEYGVVHSDYRTHNRDTGDIQEVVVSTDRYSDDLQLDIFTGKFKFCNATMMYRKKLIDKYLPLDDYIRYQFTLQDWNTWMILSAYTKFYCLPVSTATFGVETESITRPKTYEQIIKRFDKEQECYRYVCSLFSDKLDYKEQVYLDYKFHVLLNLAYKERCFPKAKEYASQIKENSSLKIVCARHYVLFLLYNIFKKYLK